LQIIHRRDFYLDCIKYTHNSIIKRQLNLKIANDLGGISPKKIYTNDL
jgi:hypothetical protein